MEKFDPLSIFVQSEVEPLLANKGVSTIDGLSRAGLVEMAKTKGLDVVIDRINVNAVSQVAASGLSVTNVDDYLHRANHLDEYLAQEPHALNRLTKGLQTVDGNWRGELKPLTTSMIYDAAAAYDPITSTTISAAGSTLLKRLGVAGTLIGLGLAAGEAAAQDARGDRKAAIRTMEDWAMDAAASGVGSMIGGALAGLALGALAAAGVTVGAPLTLAAMLAGGMIGGVAGAEAGMSLLDRIRGMFDTAKKTVSPLVLDLDRDGIDTLSVRDTARIHFDHDANGFAERTGWISRSDAFLVRDLDGNGRIDSGRELFGNHTRLSNGATAGNGFIALAELDLNRDGVIDLEEAAHARLLLWRDANSNGITDDGELLTLAEAGVASLLVNYTHSNRVDASGNAHRQLGFFVAADGAKVAMNDVWFAADLALTVNQQPLELSEAILALPEIAGMGGVPSLRQAMARDDSGQLQRLVEEWVAADATARPSLMENLIFHWAGVQDADPASRWSASNGLGDSRRLLALERWLGESFKQASSNSQDPRPDASGFLRQAFELLAFSLERELLLQTDYARLLNRPDLILWDTTQQTFAVDQRALLDLLADRHAALWADSPYAAMRDLWQLGQALRELGAGGKVLVDALQAEATARGDRFGQLLNSTFNTSEATILNVQRDASRWTYLEEGIAHVAILGGEQSEVLSAGAGNDELYGGAGNDRLFGNHGDDILHGGSGDDHLEGGAGDDTLHGGTGNDYLEGGTGRDTYRFHLGDGQDRIYNYDGGRTAASLLDEDYDQLVLGEGLSAATTRISRQGDHLTLSWASGDSVTIQYYFASPTYRMPIQFAEGVTWRMQDIASQLNYIGTDASETMTGVAGYTNRIDGRGGNDTIRGGDLADVLSGGDGNDSLYGGAGDDTLHGGTGNDYLEGGTGRDIYRFHLGDGQDRIYNYDGGRPAASLLDEDYDQLVLGEGLSAAETRTSRQGEHLTLSWASGDSVTIQYYFASPTYRMPIQFAEGVTWRMQDIASQLNYIGNDASETMTGVTGYSNRIDGRGGNDTIRGGDLADVLSGGDGNDSLYGGAGDDTLHGGTGNDYLEGGTGRDTYRFHLGDGQDRIYNDDGGRTAASLLDEDYDQLVLGEGLSAAETRTSRQGEHLTLSWASGDSVTIQYYFASPTYRMPIQFAEGVTWRMQDIASQLNYIGNDASETMTGVTGYTNRIHGRGGADTLRGGALADVLSGDDGNDVLDGGAGDDILMGGTGNDQLYGGVGNDLFLFRPGDGADVISYSDSLEMRGNDVDTLLLGRGLNAADTMLSRQGLDLQLSWGGADAITVRRFFAAGETLVDRIVFADGAVWSQSAVSQALTGVEGTVSSAALALSEESEDETLAALLMRVSSQGLDPSAWMNTATAAPVLMA
ncbi:calcium-binding protein [Roseateles amylovorans]|uniref:Haemolysin-type calcium binding-related domain-containing protein n=1 Tax=Roseateles amylovorans TaxID=2978473 RepID=A0ABY6B0C0_9BURK|nr:calcium-binding protein [Roseateles amylovorans]UXH78839.1 hypothetical protein N4261_02545 [Roseateles amylovorans]